MGKYEVLGVLEPAMGKGGVGWGGVGSVRDELREVLSEATL